MRLAKILPEALKAPIRALLHSKRLTRSQAGQDIWVFGEVFNEMKGGFFLDIGASDGVEISNTYMLEKKYGWNGICVEANKDVFQLLRRNRGCLCVNACLDSTESQVDFYAGGKFGGIVSDGTDNKPSQELAVETVNTTTLERLLGDCSAPKLIDYLSIDVEGAEERILLHFPFDQYRFNCLTVERPTDRLRTRLAECGYVLIKEIPGLDCFYVHADYLEQYFNNTLAFFRKKLLVVPLG